MNNYNLTNYVNKTYNNIFKRYFNVKQILLIPSWNKLYPIILMLLKIIS